MPSREITTRPGSTPFATMRSRMSSPSTITRAARRSAQRCIASQRAVKLPGRDNRAADGHVRIHVADVVNEGPARQARHEGAGDAFDGRIGHGQNHVRANRKRARDGERKIGQIIRNAAAHLETRKGRGADALDGKIAADFAAQADSADGVRSGS